MKNVVIEFGDINVEVPRNEVANYFVNTIFPKLMTDYARELQETIDGYNAKETDEDKFYYADAECFNFCYCHFSVIVNLSYNLQQFPELRENAQFMAAHDEFFKYVVDNVQKFFLDAGSPYGQDVFGNCEDEE